MAQKIDLMDSLGKEVAGEVVAIFNNPKLGHSYVAYTDGSKEDESIEDILVSIYKIDGDKIELEPIEDEAEWNYIDTFLKEEIFMEDDYE